MAETTDDATASCLQSPPGTRTPQKDAAAATNPIADTAQNTPATIVAASGEMGDAVEEQHSDDDESGRLRHAPLVRPTFTILTRARTRITANMPTMAHCPRWAK